MSRAARGGYDHDVVVIGAGPAGLAAAIRLRWVKGYEPTPASVVLVDPEPPGGLAAMGGCVLTGPGWATNAEGLVPRLLADVEALAIPVERVRATGLARGPHGMVDVALADGRSLRAHAAIVATGFRALHGEARWFHRGVTVTCKGYGFLDALVARSAEEAAGRGLAIIGHGDTLDLLPLFGRHAERAGGITLVLQPPLRPGVALPTGVTVRWGRTAGYEGDEALEAVRLATGERVAVGRVLVDYHAFERRPEAWETADATLRPQRDERGFVAVDASMATSEPGVFAAGDVTGRYASTVMALGDGTCAGFSAYAYSFQRKLGVAPSLFAYAATGPLPDADGRVPLEVPADAVIVPFGEDAPFAAGTTVAALRAEHGSGADARLLAAMHQRRATVHRIPGLRAPPPGPRS